MSILYKLEHDVLIKLTEGVLKATSSEVFLLWKIHANDNRETHTFAGKPYGSDIIWEEDCRNWDEIVGFIKGKGGRKPVKVNYGFFTLDGHVVCHYDQCSQAGDWEMVEGWVKKTFPGKYRSNVLNFHNLMRDLREKL